MLAWFGTLSVNKPVHCSQKESLNISMLTEKSLTSICGCMFPELQMGQAAYLIITDEELFNIGIFGK